MDACSKDCTVAPRTLAMSFNDGLLKAVRDEGFHDMRDAADDADHEGGCTVAPRIAATDEFQRWALGSGA